MWVARPAGMLQLQFLTLFILTLSQQRIWWCVEFSVSLPRMKLCRWWKRRLWVSLGEQSRACGPWKLSNNNSAAAKSPHLLGHTTLGCWFLSICSPTHPNIPANCCGSYHQCWSCRIAEGAQSHTKAQMQTAFHLPLRQCHNSEKVKRLQFQKVFDLVARQTDCVVLHLNKGRRACSCDNIQESSRACCKFSPVTYKPV